MSMPPNNPMTEGEALAVIRGAAGRTPHREDLLALYRVHAYLTTRLTAHTAASGGEVVAWQYKDADWKEWASITREQFDKYTSMPQSDSWTVRALYTAPPAAVPADALERLVEELREKVRNELGQGPSGNATLYCAGRIAALIPKGAGHG